MNLNFLNLKKNKVKRDYCVIGLGRFGYEVAKILQTENQNLTVIDQESEVIDGVGKDFNNSILADATNIRDLTDLGVETYDVVIVAISNIERSITVCSNLRELGVKNIIAKAQNKMHQRILKSMGILQTVIPEIEIASKVTYQSIYGVNIDIFEFDTRSKSDVFIIEVPVFNKSLWHSQVSSINLVQNLSSTIISIRRSSGEIIVPVKGNDTIQRGDYLFLITKKENITNIKNYFAVQK